MRVRRMCDRVSVARSDPDATLEDAEPTNIIQFG